MVDLEAPDYETPRWCTRAPTNTFPSWDRAQPNRFMSHNGEINTLLGNKRDGCAAGHLVIRVFGDDLRKLMPIVEEDCSDSGTFDNVLEFLLMSGRKLQAVLMMIPEGAARLMDEQNAFRVQLLPYGRDGPASILFTAPIGAVLDGTACAIAPLHHRRR